MERFNPEARKVIDKSLTEALQFGCLDIGPEHLLLAMLQPGGIAHLVFARNDNWHESSRELRQEVISYLTSEQRKKEEQAKEELPLTAAQLKEVTRAIQDALLRILAGGIRAA